MSKSAAVIAPEPTGRAIAYFANGIGNFILMMPALQAVASLDRRGKIDLVLSSEWKDQRKAVVEEIARAWPIVDSVLHPHVNRIHPAHYDLWYWSPHSSSGEMMGVFRDRSSHIPVARPAWNDSLIHEADHCMEIARAMGYDGPVPKVEFPLADGPNMGDKNRPIIGLCNGSFGVTYWRKKRWPHFARLAECLRRGLGATVIGIGGEKELDGVSVDMDFAGRISITQTAKALAQMDLLVTTDTGCMHLADMLGIPLIALFGPTLTSKNCPRGEGAMVLQSGRDCSPCQDSARLYRCTVNACMESITVGDVMGAVISALGRFR